MKNDRHGRSPLPPFWLAILVFGSSPVATSLAVGSEKYALIIGIDIRTSLNRNRNSNFAIKMRIA